MTATSAQAQVCATERPDWSPLDGPVSALQELEYFGTSPLGIALIVLFLAHLVFANRLTLYLTLVTAAFAILAQTEMFWAPGHLLAQSYSEGCRGVPWATLPLIAALAIGAVLRQAYAWRRSM
ncbi:hypothetical protein [Algirhabdus cladophorae]|uniref:hypothetical protein n=1 Tax=Algirhabdus cladophorae TaxID=3377108 RepID=UPI003B846C63